MIHNLPCALCVIAILAVYAHQFAREWREYHPKLMIETAIENQNLGEFPDGVQVGAPSQFA
ncbi:MAG TPA: hypothetical protein VE291_05715 [Terracidiphilus sp.]|jgi:hypothetical protein|nr:hypothetical protein [Terracidiphilus sp.]